MKSKLITALGLSLIVANVQAAAVSADAKKDGGTAKAAETNSALKSDSDKLSYTIGADIGENLKSQNIDVNPSVVSKGLTDALTGQKLLMTKEQMQETISNLQKKLVEEQKKKFEESSQKNASAGKAFLEKNKAQKGVVTLPSGLQYKIVDEGKGASPTENDFVTVDYEGKLTNGEVFDSSYQRGKPVQFKVSQVITGWQEALQKMKSGATWELFIPPELAYGERGLGGPIGPNETLVFKVHLISIDKEAKDNAPADKTAEEATKTEAAK